MDESQTSLCTRISLRTTWKSSSIAEFQLNQLHGKAIFSWCFIGTHHLKQWHTQANHCTSSHVLWGTSETTACASTTHANNRAFICSVSSACPPQTDSYQESIKHRYLRNYNSVFHMTMTDKLLNQFSVPFCTDEDCR